jgi:Tol biopolymer transport system component
MRGGRAGGPIGFAVGAALLLAALVTVAPVVAQAAVGDLTLVSRGADGTPAADGDSGPGLAISASGRFIAFESKAGNLSVAAQPGVTNIYLRDRRTGTTTLISRASGADGAGADADSANPAISPAGRFVAFESTATNLSADDGAAVRDVFVRDTSTNTTTLVSRPLDGGAANGDSSHPAVSANASVIAFDSTATNLTTDTLAAASNVFARHKDSGETELVSRVAVGSSNFAADGNSYGPTIDQGGLRVAFTSDADNLYAKDNNAYTNVFVTDLQGSRYTSAVSLPTGNFLQQDPSDGDSFDGVISADGKYVAFVSYAANFVDEPIRTPTIADVFRRDIQGTKTELVSRATGIDGEPSFADSAHPSISGDGRFIAFESAAGNLSSEDTAGSDVFIRAMNDGTTTLVSRGQGAAGPAGDSSSYAPALSADGRSVAFSSDANNLSTDDDDQFRNVFARQVPVTPPPPQAAPDLGTNDHSGHAGHDPSSPGHAGHTAAEHAGHTTVTGGPAMTLFGPPVQDIDKLFMLATLHADGRLVVSATVALKGRSGASKLYRFRGFTATVPAHREYRVKLTLAKSKLRAVKRALKRHRRLKAKIVAKAQSAAGGPWSTVTRSVRLTN